MGLEPRSNLDFFRRRAPVTFLREFFKLSLNLFWPVSCPICGRLGTVLCEGCLTPLFRMQLPRCLSCGGSVPCPLHPNSPEIHSGALYAGHMKILIHQLKYKRFASLGPRLGWGLGQVFTAPVADLLLPVPLHLGSPRRYNQAEGIALGLSRAWGLEVWNAAWWMRRVEARVNLKRSERRALPSDVFEVDGRLKGLRVLLVDDVSTTGTTLSRLASACRKKGAVVVGAYVLAHVPA
ncbi:MAG: ComF family protein [Fretibacterium sp.]|nr:ComF family protein [Fretibacterium sp.]